MNIIQKEHQVIEAIRQKGIVLIIPDNEFSTERIAIEVHTNHLSQEEIDLFKEVLGL